MFINKQQQQNKQPTNQPTNQPNERTNKQKSFENRKLREKKQFW